MPRSDQLAQAQPEQVMLPPPFRHPRKLIDEYESEDDMDGINEISGGNYFSNAQKILNNPEDARLSIPSNRPNWNTKTIPAKVQLGSKNFHKSQPPIYSLSPLSTPTSIRTYSNVPLKEIIKRREIVPLRRPTISGSFKSPFLSKSPMTNMDQALVPSTSEFICQGQEHGTMPISNQSPFIIPTSIIPSTFAIEFDNKAKRCMTESEPFPLSTSTHASRIGPRRATQAAPLKAHRGMTIRFEASQKPFKPPLMTKPLKSILRTGRQASGFDTTDDSPILVNPRKKIITKARTKSGQEGLGEGAQCAGKRKVVTSSFAEVQAAW
ncbi:hypothetical protein L873DRAFT_141881 [Choiromyces venosus 120613-1]|uniref:Uncharacterized protein n=1 Tax=Choiromyces venosus 120613-1 TaxID=1336337 RepID=A0A3N4JFW0_9PEZI|nr:hypothetical protein L873DRAFT_141881 [Choiromyces venosus 120613-1]